MSAATVDQGGLDHVNEQPHEYWIEKMRRRGFEYDRQSSLQVREEWAGKESWASVAQLIERRLIRLPQDEKLVAQLTSRQRGYDSRGRLRLEPKDDLRNRGVESPDRADAVCGAVALRLQADPYAFDPVGRQNMGAMMQKSLRLMERSRAIGYVEHVNWDLL